MTAPVAAVIFDVDGTLIRSVELHADAYRRTLAPLGIEVTDNAVYELEGARSESIVREFLEAAGQEPDAERIRELADAKQREYERLGPPEPYDGAFDMVREMNTRGFPIGIVTGTKKVNVERLLKPLLGIIDVVVAQEHYEKDKPHPEPYFTASRALGTNAANCLVLENAPRGVESARRAGTQVAAIPTTVPAHVLQRTAHWVIDHHPQFKQLAPEGPGGTVRRL